MDKEALREKANELRAGYLKGQTNWSVAHHAATFGSIICSITASLLIPLKTTESSVAATTLTTLAAALTSLSSSGGFARKWRSNRLSRSKIDALLMDLEADDADLAKLTQTLKEIMLAHDQEIVNSSLRDNDAAQVPSPPPATPRTAQKDQMQAAPTPAAR